MNVQGSKKGGLNVLRARLNPTDDSKQKFKKSIT